MIGLLLALSLATTQPNWRPLGDPTPPVLEVPNTIWVMTYIVDHPDSKEIDIITSVSPTKEECEIDAKRSAEDITDKDPHALIMQGKDFPDPCSDFPNPVR